jgi:ATPase complex subunit ATP10
MLADLNKAKEKPILSNETLIPESQAKVFPTLRGLLTLDDYVVDIPDYFLRKNRSRDVHAQCTLVTVCFREFGNQAALTWVKPFKEIESDRIEVMRISVAEGYTARFLLRAIIKFGNRRNTDPAEFDRNLIYFGKDKVLEPFRDALRIHNSLTGFVFLLDGLGRVRFAGSGEATEEEVQRLIQFAKELITPAGNKSKRPGRKSPAGRTRR